MWGDDSFGGGGALVGGANFLWETNLLNNLLEGFVWRHGEERGSWKLEDDGIFTIKSLCNKLRRKE